MELGEVRRGASVAPQILEELDRHRRRLGDPGPVTRELSAGGAERRIVFAEATHASVATVIAEEKALADRHRYRLEWKVYGHDALDGLEDELLAAGFVAEDQEQVLVLPLGTVKPLELPEGAEIVRVRDERSLVDVAEIARDLGRTNVDAELRTLTAMLRDAPDTIAIHVARKDGEAVACGRSHLGEDSTFAELAGGRTKPAHRRRGYFTALVVHRLLEARARGRTHAIVDALPSSEPLLKRLGFTSLTTTRPYRYEPAVT